MELKCLKQCINVNEIIHSGTVEQAVDVDFTLPDYCPDVSKIFKCRASAHISAKGISGKNITVDGSVTITVIYADRDNTLCSYEYQYPFSKNIETAEDCSGANLSVTAKCEYINCRAVTGRKIDIHGAVAISVKVFKVKQNEIISDIEDANIEQRHGSLPATTPMGYAEKYLMVEEDISIGQGQPSAERLLRYSADPSIKESKIINGKIVVKGEIPVSILYCAENGSAPLSLKTVLPFSGIIEAEGVTDVCECETRVCTAFLEIKPKQSDGGIRGFSFTAKLLITAESYCGNDVAVILDAFSRKYCAEIVKSKISLEKIADNIKESYHCKKSIELETAITAICDLWCDIQSVRTGFEDGNMLINGTVIAGIIAIDADGSAFYSEKPIDFEYKYALNNYSENMHCTPELNIISCGYTVTGQSSMELSIDLNVNAAVYDRNETELITDIKADETKLSPRASDAALTVYFTGENECIWDVAKHYNSSVDEILRLNGLECDDLPEGKMLLIPAV